MKKICIYSIQNKTGTASLSKSFQSHIKICSLHDLKSGFHFGMGIFIFWAIVVISISARAEAAPSLKGPTGLIQVPTAEALQYKELNIGFDYIGSNSPAPGTYYYKLNLGTFKGWEIGVVGGSSPAEGVFVNAKYYLMSDNSRLPLSLAIGFEDLASSKNFKVYLMASKKIQQGFWGHFGFWADFQQNKVDAAIIGGTEYMISNQFSMLADVYGQDKIYTVNVGARYYLIESVVINAAGLDITNSQGSGTVLTMGISLSKFI